MTRPTFTFTSTRARVRIERMLAALVTPMTSAQLREVVPMCKATASVFLGHLQDAANRRIRIASWKSEVRGRHSPVYALGTAKDAPEPARLTAQAKYRRERDRLKADPFKMARFRTMRRMRENPPTRQRDPLMSWVPVRP